MLQRSWKALLLITMLALVLGVAPAALAQETVEEPGVVLVAVAPGSPAATAGLIRGDILLALDGQDVNTQAELVAVLQANAPGDRVEATYQRGGAERKTRITLGDRDGQAFLGVTVFVSAEETVTVPEAESETAPEEETATIPDILTLPAELAGGAMISEVVADSPAEAAGLEVGDLITAVDGTALDANHTLADLIGSYDPGDEVTLQLTRGDEELELTATLGENPDTAGKAYLGVRYGAAMAPLAGGRLRELRDALPEMLEEGQIPEELQDELAPLLEQLQRGYGRGFRWDFPVPDEDMPFYRMLPLWGESLAGVTVMQVSAGSPADTAGLVPGDVITAIDDTEVATSADVAAVLAELKPKDQVTLTVNRAGEDGSDDESVDLVVTLGQHPNDATRAYLGVRLARGMGMHFQLPEQPKMDQGSSNG